MTELLTATQMRALERAAIDSGTVTGLELMERAGRGVIDLILAARVGGTVDPVFTVLCGPGFTGMLGAFAAREAAARGHLVRLAFCDRVHLIAGLYPKPIGERFGTAVREALRAAFPGEDTAATQILNEGFDDRDIVIDAVFGRELRLPIEMYWREILGHTGAKHYRHFLVALDLPSGYDCETGAFIDLSEAQIIEDGYSIAMHPDRHDLTISVLGDCPAYRRGTCGRHCGEVRPLGIDAFIRRRR